MPEIKFIAEMPKIGLVAETVFHLFGLPISNSLIASWLTMLLLLAFSFLATRKMELVPRGLHHLAEVALEIFYEKMIKPRAGERGRPFLPLTITVFFFILLSNWLGALLPGFNSIGLIKHGGEFVPLLRSTCSDLNTTLALALVSVISSWIYGIKILGSGYFRRFLSIVGPMEVFGELTKLLSLSFRLFGNIFAGEVLLIVMVILLPYLAPLPFMALEVFFGFIQAYVFTTLTLIYLTTATAHHSSTS